jgi:hypothetical protein
MPSDGLSLCSGPLHRSPVNSDVQAAFQRPLTCSRHRNHGVELLAPIQEPPLRKLEMKLLFVILSFVAVMNQPAKAVVSMPDPVLSMCLAFEGETEVLSRDAKAAISNAIPLLRRASSDLRDLSISIQAWDLDPESDDVPGNQRLERPSRSSMELSLKRLNSLRLKLLPDLPEIAPNHLGMGISAKRRRSEPTENCDAVIVAYFRMSLRLCGKGPFCRIQCNATTCTTTLPEWHR